jgi:hypothetical protein
VEGVDKKFWSIPTISKAAKYENVVAADHLHVMVGMCGKAWTWKCVPFLLSDFQHFNLSHGFVFVTTDSKEKLIWKACVAL